MQETSEKTKMNPLFLVLFSPKLLGKNLINLPVYMENDQIVSKLFVLRKLYVLHDDNFDLSGTVHITY